MKQGVKGGRREEGTEEEVDVCAFGAVAAPGELGIVRELAVVGDVTGAKGVAVAAPAFFHKLFGDAHFAKVANWGADDEVGGDITLYVFGEELFGFPGLRPLVVDGEVADDGGGFVSLLGDTG